jgi:formylglycine-generating enzyme required for sulfatase activity
MRKKILLFFVVLSIFSVVFNAYAESKIGNEKKPFGNFVTIPGGIYEIGSPDTEPNHRPDERLHSVKLSSYDIGEAAVTQEQYARVTGTNPSKFKDPKDCPGSFKIILTKQNKIPVCSDYPVENINWDDATGYAGLVSANDSKYIYRLPTEAQQEVAFRSGTSTTFVSGNNESGIGDYLWYSGNSDKQTHPVKSKRPNAFGIYRSSVWEWSNDWYSKDYQGSAGLDPQGPSTGLRRVLRGGGWMRDAEHSRSARRAHDSQELRNELGSLGFRLVRMPRGSAGEKQNSIKSVGSFVTIPGGDYEIGSPDTESGHQPDERLHSVKLSSYDIGEAAVTQERYAKITGTNPSTFKNPQDCPESFKIIQIKQNKIPVCADYPVENVSWNDANRYTVLESKIDSKFIYGLPTEAQQEVAFRGGASTAFVSGNDDANLADYVWFSNSDYLEKTHSVKSKRPNIFGIYRSSVWEWSNDWYSKDYQGSAGLDPKGPATGSRRVVRGCSHINGSEDCRSAFRNDLFPDELRNNGLVGLRLVRRLRQVNEKRDQALLKTYKRG